MAPRSASARDRRVARALLDRCGRSFAAEAGIRLADRPAPLYQLLVLATLLSARISGEIAVAAARELFAAGYRTPAAMSAASWQDRVDTLGRGHYRRFDEPERGPATAGGRPGAGGAGRPGSRGGHRQRRLTATALA